MEFRYVSIKKKEKIRFKKKKRRGQSQDIYYIQSHTPNKFPSCVLFLVSMFLEPAFFTTLLSFTYDFYSCRKDKRMKLFKESEFDGTCLTLVIFHNVKVLSMLPVDLMFLRKAPVCLRC